MAKEPSKQELYDAAEKLKKEEWHPIDKALEFLASKTEAGKPVPPAPKKALKKGGKVGCKCMARGGGIEVRGKTKGRFV